MGPLALHPKPNEAGVLYIVRRPGAMPTTANQELTKGLGFKPSNELDSCSCVGFAVCKKTHLRLRSLLPGQGAESASEGQSRLRFPEDRYNASTGIFYSRRGLSTIRAPLRRITYSILGCRSDRARDICAVIYIVQV